MDIVGLVKDGPDNARVEIDRLDISSRVLAVRTRNMLSFSSRVLDQK